MSSTVDRRIRPAVLLGLAFLCYLALSTLLWWHVWAGHPTTVATCGCNDPALTVWFLAWPASALTHGHNPFYSSALFHPAGINLLSNTGILGIGIPLAPVTWLWGPVATLNVASTLGPALSALSMCWLLLRWVRFGLAAFVGGLVFGFSPFVFTNLAVGHLNLSVLFLFPLMVGCLDDLLVRQHHRPLVTGAALGGLVALEFFVSTEMLAVMALTSVLGMVLLVVYAALRRPQDLVSRASHGLRGVGTAVVVAGLLLAYPLWFALAGPAHLSGLVWPAIKPGRGGATLHNIWSLQFLSPSSLRLFAGYAGLGLPELEYLGLGMLAVLCAGVLIWRRDRRLWFFGTLGILAVVLSLGYQSYWTPWRLFTGIPLVQNVLPVCFAAMTALCASIMLGVIVDRVHDRVRSLGGPHAVSGAHRHSVAAAGTFRRALAAIAGAVVSAVALVPLATSISANVPFTVQAVNLPRWFTAIGPHLPPGHVVLTFPPPITGGSVMVWQAVDRLHFDLATGAGPESIPQRAGSEREGQAVITEAASVFADLVPATPENVSAVRRALAGWEVTDVVVPDPQVLVPRQNRASSTAWALGIFTLAIGRPPLYHDDAWVWSNADVSGPVRSMSAAAFDRCTSADRVRDSFPGVVPACAMAASSPS